MDREKIKLQIEQLTCFLDSSYAGLAHDVRIVWNYRNKDASAHPHDVASYWREQHGKHEEITVGGGDTYYSSDTIGHMLYEHAYHMRERLQDKLADMDNERTFADIV